VVKGVVMERIMVVGDVMLDRYIYGEVNRVSPEAPVPVVSEKDSTNSLGGAGNVLNNLYGLGVKVLFGGVVGYDDSASEVYRQFGKKGFSIGGIVEEDRPTSVKTRVIGNGQQIVRIDNESVGKISSLGKEDLLDFIQIFGPHMEAFIISDYNKGVVVQEVVDKILKVARDKPVICDVKPVNIDCFRGVTCVTPNKKEAEEICGFALEDKEAIFAAGQKIVYDLDVKYALITLGKKGMSLTDKINKETSFINTTNSKQVFDVSGAGDTVIATFTYGLCEGLSPIEAAKLANKAAGIVVGERGTSYITLEKLDA
jgi:D-beta-D-heptose 7-phosphate kinase/D-beta-D-heptose 1-phosphate adenosyltransferase